MRINAKTVGGVAALATAGVALTAVPAHANATAGACRTGDYQANFNLAYHNDGGYHYPDFYRWNIGGDVGGKNNVETWVKIVTPGNDAVIDDWTSKDVVDAGPGKKKIPDHKKVDRSYAMYGQFRFTFDKDGADPKCKSSTRSV